MSENNSNTKSGYFSLGSGEIRFIIGSLIALFAVRVLAMFTIPFVHTTEARYAEIARKMVETNDWITPQFNYGIPFWGKPPLHTWLSAGGIEIFGANEFGPRFFIFGMTLLLLWIFYRWASAIIGATPALVSVAVLSSAGMFFGAAAFVQTDMVMTFATTLVMMAFWNATHYDKNRKLWGLVVFVGMGLGMLAKGPVAVVLAGIPMFLWLLIGGRWRLLARLPWVSGLILGFAICLPWYIAAEIKTPGFLRYFIIGEHYERFMVSGWQGDLYGSGHAEPKGRIWLYWPITFFPWSIVSIALFTRARRVGTAFKSDADGWRSYLLLWALSPLFLFSFAANILTAYVLPGLPAAAILLVVLWNDAFHQRIGKWAKAAFAVSISVVVGVFLALAVISAVDIEALNLRQHKGLLQAMKQADPNAQLVYYGARHYSGEYYTQGQAKTIDDLAQLNALPTNNRVDALAVYQSNPIVSDGSIPDAFEKLGLYGRYVLYIERQQE